MTLQISNITIKAQFKDKELTLDFDDVEQALQVIEGRNRVKEVIGEEGDTEAQIIIEPEKSDGKQEIKESSQEGRTKGEDKSEQKTKIRKVTVK